MELRDKGIEEAGELGGEAKWVSIEDAVARMVAVQCMVSLGRMAVVECTVVVGFMAAVALMALATSLIIPAVTGIPAVMSLREALPSVEEEVMEVDGHGVDMDPVLEGGLRPIQVEVLVMLGWMDSRPRLDFGRADASVVVFSALKWGSEDWDWYSNNASVCSDLEGKMFYFALICVSPF